MTPICRPHLRGRAGGPGQRPRDKPDGLLRDGGSLRNGLSPAARTSWPCSADVVVSPWLRTLDARGVSAVCGPLGLQRLTPMFRAGLQTCHDSADELPVADQSNRSEQYQQAMPEGVTTHAALRHLPDLPDPAHEEPR